MTLRVVIPSKGRAGLIGGRSLRLFPEAIVCVDEREAETYGAVVPPAQLWLHPPLPGISAIRNWILDNLPDEAFVMADDDISHAYSKTGVVIKNYRHPAEVAQIIENACEVAQGIGAHLFGFTQDGGVFSYKPQDPFCFNNWIGTVIGTIGRGIRYNEQLKLGSEDIDISLQHLLEHRIVLIDERFHFLSVNRLRAQGGNAANRSLEVELAEGERLMRVWGPYVSVGFINRGPQGENKNTAPRRVKSIHVQRRQAKI